MARPREHDEATGEALLDAAEVLLAAGGPEAVTVRAVARDAGYATRAVYSLFGSHGGLVAALARRGYQMLADRVEAVPTTDDPAADLVDAGVVAFRGFALERPQLFRLTFERVTAESLPDDDTRRAAVASYLALVRRIRRALEAGVLAARPEEEIAFAFHACCQGLAGGELSREPPPVGNEFWDPVHGIDGAHLWRVALEALVAGLGPDGRG